MSKGQMTEQLKLPEYLINRQLQPAVDKFTSALSGVQPLFLLSCMCSNKTNTNETERN